MIFRFHQPAFPLNQFIDSIFYYEGFSPVHALDRFLPDGNTELILNLTDSPQHIHDNITLKVTQSCHNAWVSGVRTRPITIPSGKGNRMMVVVFKKGLAHPFYRFPMSELTDSVVMAELVFGCDILDLRERLLASHSIDEMFCLMEMFLVKQAGERLHNKNACIEFAVVSIVRQPGLFKMQNLLEQIDYSQKHFIDLFKRQVGVTPKQYLRIMRFQNTVQELERTASGFDWSGLALQNGFYDQAHFINDFRDLSGFTPNEYMKRKSDSLNYVPVL